MKQNNITPLSDLDDAVLDELAIAVDAAGREAAIDMSGPAANLLRDEYTSRGRRIPLAYSDRLEEPKDWR